MDPDHLQVGEVTWDGAGGSTPPRERAGAPAAVARLRAAIAEMYEVNLESVQVEWTSGWSATVHVAFAPDCQYVHLSVVPSAEGDERDAVDPYADAASWSSAGSPETAETGVTGVTDEQMSDEQIAARAAHRDAADAAEMELAGRIFDELCQGRHGDLDIGDLEPEGAEVDPAYDPTAWPVVMVDRQGRRYEVDVTVTARILGTVEQENAKRELMAAALEKATAAAQETARRGRAEG